MKLSIIIPTWNNAWYTIKCLRSIKARTSVPYEIVWIDNGSSDHEHKAMLAEMRTMQSLRFERHPKPLGFPKAINRGFLHAKGSHVCLMNNDVEVLPGWETELIKAVDQKGGAAGPVAIQPGGWQAIKFHPWLGIPAQAGSVMEKTRYLQKRWGGHFIEIPDPPTRPGWRAILAFFCTVMKRTTTNRIGPLDERFGWGFGDDTDYAIRLRKAGHKLWLCPGSLVIHALSKTMNKIPGGIRKQMTVAGNEIKKKWRSRL